MNGPLLSSIIFDWPCWADWLISFICNHYCKERQLQQQKQNKRIFFFLKVEELHHKAHPDTLLLQYNARSYHPRWWKSIKSLRPPLPKQQNLHFYKFGWKKKCEQDKKMERWLCQKVNHISSGNSFCHATAVRTATPAPAREKRQIIIRCQREMISWSMILHTQKDKK